jgi:glyoxylase-like metal-dependent hydrolase (beta-lactamase superfamily II)
MIGEGAGKTGAQAGPLRDVRTWGEQKVKTVRLSVSNVYLARGETGSVLVDAGDPGNGKKIMEGLAKVGAGVDEVALILLTHGHVDHFGSAAELRKLTGAPVAIHEKDEENLRRGRNPHLPPTGLEGRLIKPFLKHQAPPVAWKSGACAGA